MKVSEFAEGGGVAGVSRVGREVPQHHLQEANTAGVPEEFVVQSLSRVQLFAIPWTAAGQTSLSITNSWSLLKLISIESMMLSDHPILCCPLLLPPSIFPSISVFSNESVLHIRWPKYWSLSFSISPSNEYSGLISFRMDWLHLLAVQNSKNPNKKLLELISEFGKVVG